MNAFLKLLIFYAVYEVINMPYKRILKIVFEQF